MVEVLAAVVLGLTGHPTTIHCGHVPQPDVPGLQGAALPGPDPKIWLESCRQAYRPTRMGLLVFAHEIIHLLHPEWPHWKIYKWDDWYAEKVVRWKLEREKARRGAGPTGAG